MVFDMQSERQRGSDLTPEIASGSLSAVSKERFDGVTDVIVSRRGDSGRDSASAS